LVGDEVGRQITPIELHPFHHIQLGIEGLGLLNGDDTVFGTLSMASEIIWPTSSSLPAETVATWAIALPSMGLARAAISSTSLVNRFVDTPTQANRVAARRNVLQAFFRIMAWASTVAVVVPSPAKSLVLEATSCISGPQVFS
jgi:hypothetical protein